jgi:hypothetical protein
MQTLDRPQLTPEEQHVLMLMETARRQYGLYEAAQSRFVLPPLDQDETEDYSSYDYRRPLTLTVTV